MIDKPVELISVGVFLKELVEVLGISHKDFAAYIGLRSSNLSALYSGNRRFNHDLALKLVHQERSLNLFLLVIFRLLCVGEPLT